MAHRDDCPCPACRYRRGEGKGQAPQLSVRLDPAVRDYLLSHPDGARATLERLVAQAQDQAAPAPPPPGELEPVLAELSALREKVRELESYRRAYQQLKADHGEQGRQLRQLAFDHENARAALATARHGLEQFAHSEPGAVFWEHPESLPVVARSVLVEMAAKLAAQPLPRARRRRL